MHFDSTVYGEEVARILALDGGGHRLMPLAPASCSSEAARRLIKERGPQDLFPGARAPEAALSGLYIYFSCLDEAHEVAQDISSPEGSYWHGIMHRQEPDPGNAAYWFRRVGTHPIFTELWKAAADIVQGYAADPLRLPQSWDAFFFIEVCEKARSQPGSALERQALEIQRAEWQLLFEHCARRPPERAL